MAEDAVWLGLLICAYRPGGGGGAGLVVIAGLLPAVALAPLTAAALAPNPRDRVPAQPGILPDRGAGLRRR